MSSGMRYHVRMLLLVGLCPRTLTLYVHHKLQLSTLACTVYIKYPMMRLTLNECERTNVYIKKTSKVELIIETCSIRDQTALFNEDRQ